MTTKVMTFSMRDPFFKPQPAVTTTSLFPMSLEEFEADVSRSFESRLGVDSLLSLSKRLQAELRDHMISSAQCMLPSFNYTLPSGEEHGTFLAVEVGGSNLRMALVDLCGRAEKAQPLRVRRTAMSPITPDVKALPGYSFFDWMAREIGKILTLEGETRENAEPLRMGVAWSFPVDQTSMRSGNVLGMGKGFVCSDLVRGHDLGDIFDAAFEREHVNVRLSAIVNDTTSSLLSRAYLDSTTRLAIVLGTGINAAIHLPLTALHPSKFNLRTVKPGPHDCHVLTNTELSMFGRDILPTSKWDDALNAAHMVPDYQPLEYLIAGGYMGEIARRIIVDAVETAGLFEGELPPSLSVPYSLDTKTIASIQLDTSAGLTTTRTLLHDKHPSAQRPTAVDAQSIQRIITSISRRSVAYFATGVHALTSLLQDLDMETEPLDHISIGCDGSVINKYPQYMASAQDTLDQMRQAENEGRKRVLLEETVDGAVLGAAVAGALGSLAVDTR